MHDHLHFPGALSTAPLTNEPQSLASMLRNRSFCPQRGCRQRFEEVASELVLKGGSSSSLVQRKVPSEQRGLHRQSANVQTVLANLGQNLNGCVWLPSMAGVSRERRGVWEGHQKPDHLGSYTSLQVVGALFLKAFGSYGMF